MAISSNDALSVLRRFTDEGRPVLVIGVSKTCLSLFTGSLAQLTDEAVILQHAGTLGIGLVVSFSNVTSFDFADVREFTKFISSLISRITPPKDCLPLILKTHCSFS